MKGFIKLLALLSFAIVTAISMTNISFAVSDSSSEFNVNLSDLGATQDFFKENGVDVSDPSSIKNLTANSLFAHFIRVFRSALKEPTKIFLTVLIISLICEAVVSVSTKSGVNGELFAIICFLSISPMLISSFSDVIATMKSQQTFMNSYLPVFAAITAASGNAAGAAAYNAILLYASESVSLLAGSVLKPLIGVMLVMSCIQAINPELSNITAALKRFVTTVIGFIMTIFVGVIGLQTAVGKTGNEIVLKAGKYLVSSFVPIIGMSLSESYKTVRLSLSAMRSAIGAVGIVAVVIILSVPIIKICVYKMMFTLLDFTCSMTGSRVLSQLVKGLADVYSMIITLLLIYALTFLISTGLIILIGGEVYA